LYMPSKASLDISMASSTVCIKSGGYSKTLKDMLMSLIRRRDCSRCRQSQRSLFLPGFRESALRASRAMVGGAARGRGRPSDDD
jgi:hypothetical protein